ncbi:MAG: glycosyltransferase [Thermotogota bacterium]|nr:glycosyltransferase [Thermotogota bacterium]
MPTYNSEKILPLCLESIRGQDYPEGKLEIIVVDGGSEEIITFFGG